LPLAGAGAGGGAQHHRRAGRLLPVKVVQKRCKIKDLRVAADLRNEKITYKIREHSLQKLPYILVVGDKEKAAGAVAVRARGNQDLGVMSLMLSSKLIANGHRSKA
jgi:threonyl-tRNA synthetase